MNLQLLKKKNPLDDEEDDSDFPPGFGASSPDDESDDSEQGITQSAPKPIPQDKPTLSDRFSTLYKAAQSQPTPPAAQRLNTALDSAPNREDYKPGKLNRLAAILGGASEGWKRGAGQGIRTAQDVLDSPFDRASADYKTKIGGLEKAEEVESKNIGRQASFARTAEASERADQLAQAHADDLAARQAHWTAQDKAAADKAKAGGFQHIIGADGHMYFIKPNADGTHTTIDAGKNGESIPEKSKRLINEYKAKEGIRVGGEKDLEGLKHNNRLNEEDNTSVNSRINTNIAAGQRRTIDEENADAITERGKNTPQSQNADAQLKMKKIFGANGETVKQYFNFDQQGNPVSLKPGTPDDEDYQKVYQYIYGKAKAKK